MTETPDPFSASVDELTQALGDHTRRAIYQYVRESGDGVTAGDVAEHFEIHANVARHHLEKLVEAGFLALRDDDRGQRGAGRPSKVYGVSHKEVAVSLPFRDDRLLIDLLLTTLTTLEPDEAALAAERAGRSYGARYADAAASATGGQLSLRDALSAVADAMREKGFGTDADPEGQELVAHSCPFGRIAEQFPHVVCALDRGMVEGMLERLSGRAAEAHIISSRARGDAECITTV